MFTGVIEEIGSVLWIRATERGTELEIAAPRIAKNIRTGDSVAVNGCCLTVTAHRAGQITFDLLEETLQRTNLKNLRRESFVNLERALPADGRLGGHFVQGHIDCASRVRYFEKRGADHRLEVELPAEFARYAVLKGSIAMWQSPTWNGQEAAFRFYVAIIGVLIYLNQPDADLATS